MDFFDKFEDFCDSKRPTGKPGSYRRAIEYLSQFLNISPINKDFIIVLLNSVIWVRNQFSEEYENFRIFLYRSKRVSYLTGGFVSAALTYFSKFIDVYEIE